MRQASMLASYPPKVPVGTRVLAVSFVQLKVKDNLYLV